MFGSSADCQNMFPSGESVFKRLTHLQGSYAASTMGNSLFTKDILVRDEFYVKQLRKFRFALIGRILLNKGIAPVPILGERWKI